MKKRTVLIVTGPTGVGKTEFVDALCAQCPIEIINGDMGQMYTPLSIGTAKPVLAESSVPYYLFDTICTPTYFSAMKFRSRVLSLIHEIWDRDRTPVIVGGSSFYLLSLFFPTAEDDQEDGQRNETSLLQSQDLWHELERIDPDRAREIDPKDTYRLERALAIWKSTGQKPSDYKPTFDPFAATVFVWLERDRAQLYDRINERVLSMIDSGWIEEVQSLDDEWEQFLKKKKIIGYDTIFEYLAGAFDKSELVAGIQKKTRNYAKRQMTFWRSFKRKLIEGYASFKNQTDKPLKIVELNLTHDDIERYIKQLKNEIGCE
jgi:tRNA dimethylallyltransferase